MTQIIPNGGNRASQDRLTGAVNEITVDQSNKELRLHDGATPGGARIPNIDTNDARYQKRNAELDEFKFSVAAKGLLTRVGAGVFAIRKLVEGDGIKIENPDFVKGDCTIRLGDVIPGDRQFNGQVLFKDVVQIEGGLNAAVAGKHTGESIGKHTGLQVGDVDVRGKTLSLDNEQIEQTKIKGLAASLASTAFPVGAIILWAGLIANIPPKWALCDGSKGTPDLRGRFILGCGADDEVFDSGGTATHSHVVTAEAAGTHSHGIEVKGTVLDINQLPSHNHNSGVGDSGAALFVYGAAPATPSTPESIDNNSNRGTQQGITSSTGGNQPHTHEATSADAGNHTHRVAMEPGNNIPPYMALCYIMKIQ